MESRRVFASRVLAAAALAAFSPAQGEPIDRAKALQSRFIAPCCWSESVAVHRSEPAATMRAEIARMVASGASDDDIIAFYVARHGERILLEPRGQKLTWLTVIPVAALGAGAVALARYLKRKRAATAPETAPAVAAITVPDEDLEW
ncbi:MAG TPA: cytochrome c-type biogenesis protein CcmH [Paludibaculum sp.]|jgi:cytochrome c-type biogenesis protein CcmH